MARKIVIAIPTCKRPKMLKRALVALESTETDHDVRVLVADNDVTRREGLGVVDELTARGYRFPLSAILVTERGIPQVRNALVERALVQEGASTIVFIDDDQWPEPQWLSALIAMQEKTGADVVGCAVVPDFEVAPPAWARTSTVYRAVAAHDGEVKIVYGTCGVLISSRVLDLEPLPWFDPDFALTGGEDADFFNRLRNLGIKFASAKDSIVYEVYPASRVTLRWALKRAYRIGCSDVRILKKAHSIPRLLATEGVKIMGVFLLAPLFFLACIGQPGRQVNVGCKVARACGKISSLIGAHYEEYATTHGN